MFLCLLVSFLGDYQQFVTVLRFHPRPSFAFNKVHPFFSLSPFLGGGGDGVLHFLYAPLCYPLLPYFPCRCSLSPLFCMYSLFSPLLQEAYLQSHSIEDSHSLLHKIVDGIPLMDFVHSRSLPFRKCDHFDEVRLYTPLNSNKSLICVGLMFIWKYIHKILFPCFFSGLIIFSYKYSWLM